LSKSILNLEELLNNIFDEDEINILSKASIESMTPEERIKEILEGL